MKKITDFLGKRLISIYESKILGTIKNIAFDKEFKCAKWLIAFDESEIVDEKIVALEDIFNVGESAVMVKSQSIISPASNFDGLLIENNPINKLVYSLLGKERGKVVDVLIDDHNKVTDFCLDDKTNIAPNDILSQSENIIILKDPNVKFRISSAALKTPVIKEEYKEIKVWAMDETPEENNITPINAETAVSEQPEEPHKEPEIRLKAYQLEKVMPNKAIANSVFLIGRKVGKDIETSQGAVLIKKGTTITQKTILLAHKNSKLKDLTATSF